MPQTNEQGEAMNTLLSDEELKSQLRFSTDNRIPDECYPELLDLINTQKRLYAERERAIAEYQLAEKLYGDVTSIYLFKDGGDIKSPILKEYTDDRARELLEDCERYMNDNAKVYAEYINELRAEQRARIK